MSSQENPLHDFTPQRIEADGFAILTQFLGDAQLQSLRDAVAGLDAAGVRHLGAKVAAVGELAASAAVRDVVTAVLGPQARLVRSLFFNKDAEHNWHVSWHQDLTIAVVARHEVAGFGGWSVKESVPHVQAPSALLERMLTLRVHLDAADACNGALWVAPGSHRCGQIRDESAVLQQCRTQVCAVAAGDALLMRPLLLHASRKSTSHRPRRVVHLEFAAPDALPAPLQWAEPAAYFGRTTTS